MRFINEQLSVFSLGGFGQAEVREGKVEGAFSRPVQTERSSTEGTSVVRGVTTSLRVDFSQHIKMLTAQPLRFEYLENT